MPRSAQTMLASIPWERALGFTGHRPEKLPTGAKLDGLQQALYYQIRCAVDRGFTHFLTGLADGIDYYAANYLFHLRREQPEIRVIGIQPCKDYESFFCRCGYNLSHLHLMTQNVDELIVLPGSAKDKGIFLKRDRILVDSASCIIAVCRDGRSGSMYTLNYTRRAGIPFCRIYPEMPDGSIPPPEKWLTEQVGF